MADWRIHYDDGTTVSDDDMSPWEAPPLGVVCITQHSTDETHTDGHELVHRFDYYWYDPDGQGRHSPWWGGDWFGFIDYMMRPGERKVVFGRTLDSDRYNAVIHSATSLREFSRGNRR